MYDRSIPTLAYVFIGLTSCIITYSHIMSNSGDTNNIDGMPSFVQKEIEEQQEINDENPIENAIAPVETKVINDISENIEQNPIGIEQKPIDESQKPPEIEQKPVEEIQKPPEMEQKPVEEIQKPQNLGGKKQKKSRKKKHQSRRSLREKKKKSKSNNKK